MGTLCVTTNPVFIRFMKYYLKPHPCHVIGSYPLIRVMYICCKLDECVMYIVDCLFYTCLWKMSIVELEVFSNNLTTMSATRD